MWKVRNAPRCCRRVAAAALPSHSIFCAVETRCQQMTHHVDQLVMTLSCHYGTQMLKLPKSVKQMKMRDFVAKYGCDIGDVSNSPAHRNKTETPYHVFAEPPTDNG